MATIFIGSARHDERNKYTGGTAGDQLQTSSSNDTKGEVSIQSMYTHSKGWNIIRPIMPGQAELLAEAMLIACNNKNIGYDQGGRYGVVTRGIKSSVKTEADCSSLVRACVKYAMGVDVGDFTTANALKTLVGSGLFMNVGGYVNQSKTPIYNGDVLCTKSKGHIVIVVSGSPRTANNYYPKCSKSEISIVNALKSVGEKDTSLAHRKKIGAANNLSAAVGTVQGNEQMLVLLKNGKLKKA